MQPKTAVLESPPPPIQTAKCSLFSKKNPVIRNFSISGWLAVPVNPDNWSSTLLIHSILVLSLVGIPACCLHPVRRLFFYGA